LHSLGRVLDVDLVTGAIAKKILHRIRAITHNDKKLAHSSVAQSFDDVLQDRFAAHFDHRFGKIGRELAHARPATGCEQNRLVDLRHLVMSSEVETSLNVSEIVRDSSTSVGMTKIYVCKSGLLSSQANTASINPN